MSSYYIKLNIIKAIPMALFFSLSLVAIIFLQYSYDLRKKEKPLIEPAIMPASAIKMADLGLHSFASAFMWLYTIQHLADFPTKLPDLIRTVNDLDPKFSYPYAFSALILPAFGFDKEAVEIAKRGIESADSDWRIPYYLATTYHIFSQDRKNAAFYFDLAARTPNADEVAKRVASRYGLLGTAREQTKAIWQSIYEISDDDIVKERAKNYIIHIEILELLEKAVGIYIQKYGANPTKLENLVTAKIMKEIPPSPLGVSFYIENGRIFVY